MIVTNSSIIYLLNYSNQKSFNKTIIIINMISQKIRENLKENPFQIGAKHINSNKTLSKELKEEMDFETLEEITERVGRSQSHFVFQFRPEHVPKPK